MTTLGDAARSYGMRGWAVLPLIAKDKVPAIKGGCTMATDDPVQIENWWASRGDDNVGIATGTPSRGLVVIDVDVDPAKGEDGYATLRAWEREHGELPETVTAITGRRGLHLYYRCNEPVANAINKELGIDIRGEGGYVVAPPSIHPNGQAYAWENDPDEFAVAAADDNVYSFIRAISGERRRGERFSLPTEIGTGTRNDTLFRYASSLQAQGYDDVYIAMALERVNEDRCRPPLKRSDVERIVHSVTVRYAKGARAGSGDVGSAGQEEKLVFRKRDRHGNPTGAVLHDVVAQELIDHHRACFVDGAPAVWRHGRYATGWDEVSRSIVELIHDAKIADQREIHRYLHLMAPQVQASAPYFVAFANGVLDLDNGLLPYDETMVITNVIPHDYNKEAYDGEADAFLDRVSCGNAVIRRNLEEVIGMCLYRGNDFGQCPVLIGAGANGKSTYILALRHVLGNENVSSLDLSMIGRPFHAAKLLGKLANLGDDISNERLSGDVLAVFKKIVTGEWIFSDVKNGEGFDFKPICTLIFSCNELPSLGDSSEGMMRRLFPIPFDAHFSRREPGYDPRIIDKLTTETAADYLIRLGIEGLARLRYQRGFTPNKRSEELVADVRADNINIIQWLDDQSLGVEHFRGEIIAERYSAYKQWCEDSGLRPFSKSKFTRRVGERFGLQSVTARRTFSTGSRVVRVFRDPGVTDSGRGKTDV